jgi:hypothetical protein
MANIWRVWNQQELDLVEERDGSLFGYEFKFLFCRHPEMVKSRAIASFIKA